MQEHKKLNVLLLSTGEFSGVRTPLMAAFARAGCDIVHRYQSLRELGLIGYWYALKMTLSAYLVYGSKARKMRGRTYAAYQARSKVSKVLVDRYPNIDVAIQISGNCDTYWGPRPANVRFAIYTDYMNLLSKALPDYGFRMDERLTYPRWNELERQTLIAQNHVFVMGGHVKPAIEAAYGVSDRSVAVVGAGPGHDLDIERDGYAKDYGSRNILFVGKQAGRKGLAVLLNAFARVSDAYPDAVLHVVTGKPVTGRNVVFHGAVDKQSLKKLFYDANIFVMPAYKEPLGLVFLEAMWSKAACIGTTVGSMPELIRDGETGYLVEPGDEVSLADRIISMLGDPERTRQMSERAYTAASSYWRWDRVVERMLAVLRQPVASHPEHDRSVD